MKENLISVRENPICVIILIVTVQVQHIRAGILTYFYSI